MVFVVFVVPFALSLESKLLVVARDLEAFVRLALDLEDLFSKGLESRVTLEAQILKIPLVGDSAHKVDHEFVVVGLCVSYVPGPQGIDQAYLQAAG